MFNQFTFSLIFSDYFQNFIFPSSSNKYSTRNKNLNFGKFDVMKVSHILKVAVRVFSKKFIIIFF